MQQGATHTEGWHAPCLRQGIFGEAGCWLGAHPLACCGVELEVAAQGHSCGLCGPWETCKAERVPWDPSKPASQPPLSLSVLNSSACFVDTWPCLSRHLLLFLLAWQPFPCLPSSWQERPHPLLAAGPRTALTLTIRGAPVGGPHAGWVGSWEQHVQSTAPNGWPLCFPSSALFLSLLVCKKQGDDWSHGHRVKADGDTGPGTRCSFAPAQVPSGPPALHPRTGEERPAE